MAKVEIEGVFAGISNQNELLRIELLNVIDNTRGAWHVVYWENILDFSKEDCRNEIVIEYGLSIYVYSYSSKYDYKIFSGTGEMTFMSKSNALNFIENNNDVFKLLKLSKEV
jgi:hypothetical protein